MSAAWRPELWLAVIALGAYHGLNPGMGWPLAVSNGMWAKREQAVFATFLPLACGHFLAMAAALLPFSLLLAYLDWSPADPDRGGRNRRGVRRLQAPQSPPSAHRREARTQNLTLWSFLTATAHGAGLMLAPIALGLCASSPERRALVRARSRP